MKRLILLLVTFSFLFISNNTKAQSYIAFPDSGAKWVNVYWGIYVSPPPFPTGWPNLGFQEKYCTNGEDTVINSLSYNKVQYCDSVYKGAVRDIAGKWYYYPKDSTNEYLLYDFTAQAGDTLYDIYCEYGPISCNNGFSNWYVDFVDSVFVGNSYRIRIHLQGGPVWIEGIGNKQGLFWEDGPNVSNYYLGLHCFSVNDTGLYSASLYPWTGFIIGGPCIPLIANTSEPDELADFFIKPNPANEFVNLSFKDQRERIIELFSISGMLLSKITTSDIEHSLNVVEIPSGVYLLKISEGNSV
ncbi:MAG: T9SS type A sorting domain-containing protein, partial [Bacteroidia bacterium]|nr:T9SS type A sorting domain-containing protein [Bacteroidia bacterium]